MSVKEQRSSVRYIVAGFDKIRARMDRYFVDERLVNISDRGCSFLGKRKIDSLEVGRRLFMNFEFEGILAQPLDVQGHLLHITEIGSGPNKGYLFGIEILEAHRPLFVPILQELEKLREKGVIATDLITATKASGS